MTSISQVLKTTDACIVSMKTTGITGIYSKAANNPYKRPLSLSGTERGLYTDSLDNYTGRVFVDAEHVPPEALSKPYTSRSDALETLKRGANKNPGTPYYELTEETGEEEGTAAYHFEPAAL